MFINAGKADFGKTQKKLYLFACLDVSSIINFYVQIKPFKAHIIDELKSKLEEYQVEIEILKQEAKTCDNGADATRTITTSATTTTTTTTTISAVLMLSTKRSTNVPVLIGLDGKCFLT